MVYYLKRKHILYILESVYGDFESNTTDEEQTIFLKNYPRTESLEEILKKTENICEMEFWITRMIDFMEENKIGYFEVKNKCKVTK